jgi:hypothetical protein
LKVEIQSQKDFAGGIHEIKLNKEFKMYRIIKDFAEDWKYESEATLKVFKILLKNLLNKK